MRYFLSFTAILCLLSFQLLGCGEDTEHPTAEVSETEGLVTATGTETSPAEPIRFTPEAVFERLWNAFGGRFEGNEDNFRRLREITASQIYLDYLAAAFPTEEPVQTLEAYFQAAPPDPERYTPFLLELVGVATEEDIAFVHWFTYKQREADIAFADHLVNPHINPKDKEEVEEIVDAVLILFTKTFVPMEDPATKDFLRRHNIPDDEFTPVMLEILAFRDTISIADVAWLRDQMETHGTDTGLVWSAIYRPALIGEILLNFNSLAGLHSWMDFMDSKKEE